MEGRKSNLHIKRICAWLLTFNLLGLSGLAHAGQVTLTTFLPSPQQKMERLQTQQKSLKKQTQDNQMVNSQVDDVVSKINNEMEQHEESVE